MKPDLVDIVLNNKHLRISNLRKRPKTAVFFDFDGTLYNGNLTKEVLLKIFEPEKLRNLSKIKDIKTIEFTLNSILDEDKIRKIKDVIEIITSFICENLENENFFLPNTISMLTHLRRYGFDIYLLSHSPVNYIKCISDYFDEIYGSDIKDDGFVFYNKREIIAKYKDYYQFIFFITDDIDMDYRAMIGEDNFSFVLLKRANQYRMYRQSFYYVLECSDALDLLRAIDNLLYLNLILSEDIHKKKKIDSYLRRIFYARSPYDSIFSYIELCDLRGINYCSIKKLKSIEEFLITYFPEYLLLNR